MYKNHCQEIVDAQKAVFNKIVVAQKTPVFVWESAQHSVFNDIVDAQKAVFNKIVDAQKAVFNGFVDVDALEVVFSNFVRAPLFLVRNALRVSYLFLFVMVK